MSYILDALQKSEQDRQQGKQAPSLANQFEAQSLTLKKPRMIWWLVGVLAVVLMALVGAFIFWFIQPAQQPSRVSPEPAAVSSLYDTASQPLSVSPPVVDTQVRPAPPSATAEYVPPTAVPEPTPTPAPIPDQKVDPRIADLYNTPKAVEPEFVYADEEEYPIADTAPPSSVNKTEEVAAVTLTSPKVVKGNPVSEPGPAVAPTLAEESSTAETEPVPGSVVEGGFMSIEQLPDTIKSEIPAIQYGAHVYAGSNKAGFAILNGKKLQSGGKLADELYLEKVDKDHIVMSYRGYFFRLPAMQHWEGF